MKRRAALVFLAALFFFGAGWRASQVIQDPEYPIAWMLIGSALFFASCGHALIMLSTTIDRKP